LIQLFHQRPSMLVRFILVQPERSV
jgi:hypothetical protein